VSRSLPGVEGPHADATLVTGGAPAAAAEVAVVLVHGRGGTPEGLVRLADEFYRPGATFLAPGAVRSNWFPAGHDAPVAANEPALTSAVDCVAAARRVARDAAVDTRIDDGDGHGLSDATMTRIGDRIAALLGDGEAASE
jgi:phospholipase/carboxylesterase